MSGEELDEEIGSRLGLGQITGAGGQTEQVSFIVWGAAVSTTRAFENVTIKIDPDNIRIFVAIRLRWWAKFDKFKPIHDAWLRIAEKRCKEHGPSGWKYLVYYEKKGDTK